MDAIKSFFLHKLTLRLLYMAGAFSASHAVALAESPKVSAFLLKGGMSFSITDPKQFQAWITAGLLFGGEVGYHFVHEKFILPHVNKIEVSI